MEMADKRTWRDKYESQKKYDSENVVRRTFKLYKKKDSDILEALDSTPNKMSFIRSAIRYYIANGCPEAEKKETDDE